MPYRPVLLLPAAVLGCFQYGYFYFNYGFYDKLAMNQLLYICIILILTMLAVFFPQRTCCSRTGEEPFSTRFSSGGPKCSEYSLEEKKDGKWVVKKDVENKNI